MNETFSILQSLVFADPKEPLFKLATVTTVDSAFSTVKVIFDGEDEEADIVYPWLGSYNPRVGDRVLLALVGSTFVIVDYITTTITSFTKPVFRSYQVANKTLDSGVLSGPGTMTVEIAEGGPWEAPILSTIRQVPINGVYRITAQARIGPGPTAGQPLNLHLRKNATSGVNPDGIVIGLEQSETQAGAAQGVSVTTSHRFSAGESVMIAVIQESGGSVSWNGEEIYSTWMELEWLTS